MSRRGWGSLGGSLDRGARPWADARRASEGPGRTGDHPEPTEPEAVALLVADAFAQTFPVLARADPARVERFQLAVEAALSGRNPRERRGRKRA